MWLKFARLVAVEPAAAGLRHSRAPFTRSPAKIRLLFASSGQLG